MSTEPPNPPKSDKPVPLDIGAGKSWLEITADQKANRLYIGIRDVGQRVEILDQVLGMLLLHLKITPDELYAEAMKAQLEAVQKEAEAQLKDLGDEQ